MNWLRTNNLGRLNTTFWSVALLVVVTTMSAAPRSNSQGLQKGISVELASTSNAVPVPDADNPDALIITVTEAGKLYFGIDPVMPGSLAQKLKVSQSNGSPNLYIKADARAPYATVVKILDAARMVGVADVTLLTAQQRTTQEGAVRFPQGIEMQIARRPAPAAK